MRIGVVDEGLVRCGTHDELELIELPERDLAELLRTGQGWRERAMGAPVRRRLSRDEAVIAPVVRSRSAVWGIGLNYASKVSATGRTPPEHPVLFLRSSMTGACPGGPVEVPALSTAVDFEGELAVVIGSTAHAVDASAAWSHVAAIVPANDLTARDVMRRTGSPAVAKSFPGFGPLGWLAATPDEFEDPDDLELITLVNGVVRQRDRTSGMLLSVPEVVSLISTYAVLHPGDVVLTGSPAGAGDEDGVYLVPGDVIEVVLADLPPLSTRVVAPRHEAGRS